MSALNREKATTVLHDYLNGRPTKDVLDELEQCIEGAANAAQYAAGRRWAARHDRWGPHTEAQAVEDHEAEQARTEQTDTWKGGNR